MVTTDEFKYYPEALRRTFSPSCVVVQVKNRYRRGGIVRTRWRLVLGTEWRHDWARERIEDGVDLLRNYCNFVRPHSALRRLSRGPKTPAMQAEIFDRPLSFREIFSWVPPPHRRTLPARVMNDWIP